MMKYAIRNIFRSSLDDPEPTIKYSIGKIILLGKKYKLLILINKIKIIDNHNG